LPFDNIDADSSDVEFQQIITFRCLSSLLTWAKNKHQLLSKRRAVSLLLTELLVQTVSQKPQTTRHVVSNFDTTKLQESNIPAYKKRFKYFKT